MKMIEHFFKVLSWNKRVECIKLIRRFFDTPIKNIKETYEKIIETGRKDFIKSNLLDYEYFPKHYKLIAIDSVSKFNQKILI